MACSEEYENQLRFQKGCKQIAGIDEAGRGPLAGPVYAAAVILPSGFLLKGLDDSKKLSDSRRRTLFDQLTTDRNVLWGVGSASSAEIDCLNILKATHLAMRRALADLGTTPCHALIDGLPAQPFPIPQTALIGGDRLSLSIAAASILAKVHRDNVMLAMDRDFPQYGFARHKGYGTKSHIEALKLHGPCSSHRRSFAPVSAFFLSGK